MKASTQYNDFVGTSAADISDHTDLKKLLASKGVDTTRFVPVGASFYAGYADSFYPSIICKDTQNSTDDNPSLVKISLDEDDNDKDKFFNLFKRMEVVFSLKHTDHAESYAQAEVKEVSLEEVKMRWSS